VAMICWLFIFPLTFSDAGEFHWRWVSIVFAFNLVVEFVLYSFWHWMTYAGPYARGELQKFKYNETNQYEPNGRVGMFWSSSGQLQREVLLSTLGFLQASVYQCVMMYLWRSGRVPFYDNFWANPLWSIGGLLFVTYWREFHFYWAHRAIHPWWDRANGLAQGDIGAFLYRHFHSLHHKSYNPGPWSGLSMHPVEHLIYFTVVLLPLLYTAHPLHFLYVMYHALVAPIGGHDGFADPGGNGDFHWLHHAKFECNYGVPLIDFDRLFGTWLDYEDYQKNKAGRSPKVPPSSGSKKRAE